MSKAAEAEASDYNLHKINTAELEQHLAATIDYGGAMFLLGSRGIGKTWITTKAISDAGYDCIGFALATYDKADFSGYPDLMNQLKDVGKQRFLDYILPKIYAPLFEEGRAKKCVVFFDELDKANPELWAPLLEFIQFGRLNSRKMPNLQAVISSGNHLSEGGQKPIPPLLDRQEKYLISSDVKSWLDWAGTKDGNIHPAIYTFIRDNPEALAGETDMGELYANESPRSWHNFSRIAHYGEKKNWTNEMIMAKCSGCVGKRSGGKFAAYFSHYRIILPLVERILKGEGEKVRRDYDRLEPTRQFMCVMTACQRVGNLIDNMAKDEKDKKIVPQIVSILGEWLATVPDQEMALMGMRAGIKFDRMVGLDLIKHKHFGSLLSELIRRMKA